MAYSSGMLDKRLTYIEPDNETNEYGVGACTWTAVDTIWCNLTWSKGATAMRAGELQSYDVVMVRTRYFSDLTRDCRLLIDGKFYHIDSYHASKQDNTIQMTATEIEAFDYTE